MLENVIQILVQTSFSTWNNEYVAASAIKYPERFVSMGLIDPMDNNNAQAAVYWMQERQVQGFRFHPQYYSNVDILKRSLFKSGYFFFKNKYIVINPNVIVYG